MYVRMYKMYIPKCMTNSYPVIRAQAHTYTLFHMTTHTHTYIHEQVFSFFYIPDNNKKLEQHFTM